MDKQEKQLREEIHEINNQMRSIYSAAKQEGRKMTEQESAEHERLYHQAQQKHSELQLIASDNGETKNYMPGSLSGGGNSGGGRALNESGSIRLYNADQQLSADSQEDGIGLGEYLRAVIAGPRTDQERTAVQNSVDSSGYSLPTYISRELIDQLRAANPLISAGARSISIEGLDTTKFVKTDSDPTAVWHTEMTEESFSDPSFSSVELAPKTVLALTEISRELLQDSQNIDEALTNAFVGSLNDAILDSTFTGTGDPALTGLNTQVSQTEEYTFGGSPDWSNFVNASKTLFDNNVPEDPRSFIYAPDVWSTLALLSDDQNRYQDAPSMIRDVPGYTSSGVPTGVSYAGDFSNCVYGYRMNITLEQHRGHSARKYATVWVAAARLDFAVFRPSALVRIEEATS